MELRRYKDILALKSEEGALLAFHARNLEVAQISEAAWQNMKSPEFIQNDDEAFSEIKSWNEENNPDVKTNKIDSAIRFLTLNVTQICNLHCHYCAAGGDGSFGDTIAKISIEKTLPQLKFFLDRLPPKVSFNINFLGGEPLLYAKGLALVAKYVAEVTPERRVNYTVITNGTLLTDQNLDILASMKAAVTVSLDGPPEINDRLRPTKDGTSSTARIIAGLKKLLSRKSEFGHLMIHGVFDNHNMELEKAYEFYSQFAVDSYDFSFSVTEDNPRATAEYMKQMANLAAAAFAKGGEEALRKIRCFEQYFQALDHQRRTENHCGAGKSFLMIDARNRIYTCPWDVNEAREQVGQGTELYEKALEAYQKPLLEANKCETCWARFLCGGGCMFAHKHASGDKNIKNTQFCERTRFMVALTLIYYEKCRSTT
ncbi:MAG: radical SAM protein [Pseudobdellovibrionaceae bacterium]